MAKDSAASPTVEVRCVGVVYYGNGQRGEPKEVIQVSPATARSLIDAGYAEELVEDTAADDLGKVE